MTLASAISILFILYYFYKKNMQKKFYLQKIEEAFFLSIDIQQTLLKNQSKASYFKVTEISSSHGLQDQLNMLVTFYIKGVKKEHEEYVEAYIETIAFYKLWLIDKEKVTKTEYNLVLDNMKDALLNFQDKLQNKIQTYT